MKPHVLGWMAVVWMMFLHGCSEEADVPQAPAATADTAIPPTAPPKPQAPRLKAEAARTAAGSVNGFSFSLYRAIDGQSNIVCSPLGAHVLLNIVLSGARDQTAAELMQTLHLDPTDISSHTAVGALVQWLPLDNRAAELNIRQAVWADRELPLHESFAAQAARDYGAELHAIDFNDRGAAAQIERWFARHNPDRGPVRPQVLPPRTMLVLTNVVRFKGRWAEPFKPERTKTEPFHISSDRTIDVAMMNRQGYMNYGQTPTEQVVLLPYRDSTLAMIVILPAADVPLREVEAALNGMWLRERLQELLPRPVALSLPRFKVTSDLDLAAPLKRIGAAIAFTEPADLTRISSVQPLFLTDARQRAMIEVDEAGTVAAAETGFGLAGSIPEPPALMQVDRPFLFMVIDRPSGAILFMGRVQDPSI